MQRWLRRSRAVREVPPGSTRPGWRPCRPRARYLACLSHRTMPCKSCPKPLLLVEEFVDDGKILFLVAHPGSVSGPVERMHPGLRIAPPELGALLGRYDVLVRLEDQDPSCPGGEFVRREPVALHEVDPESAHAAKVLFREARHELVLVVAPEYLVLRWHARHAGEGPRERAFPMRLQPSERDEEKQRHKYPRRPQQTLRRHGGVRQYERSNPLGMASHETLRHDPAVRRPEHVRDPHPLGIQNARQPVEEKRRGRYVRIVRRDDPVAILEGRDAREASLPDHRAARQEQERLATLAAYDVVPVHPFDGDVLWLVCGSELS